MIRLRIPHSPTRSIPWAAASLCIVCAALAWSAEAPKPQTNDAAEATAQDEAPKPEITRDALKAKIADLESRITIAENLISPERAQMFGMSVSDMQDQSMTLRQLRSLLEDHIGLLDDMEETARTEADLQKEIAAYKGLSQPPPYAPWFVDTYRKAVEDKTLDVETAEVELSRAKDRVARAKADEGRVDTLLAKAREDAANNADVAATPRLEWQLDSVLARRELAQAMTPYAAMEVSFAERQVAFRKKMLEFLKRKHEDAKARLRYRASDLELKTGELRKKRESAQQALQKAHSKKDSAWQRLDSSRAALDAAPEESRDQAQAVVETRKMEADAAAAAVKILGQQLELSYAVEELWAARYALHTNRKSLKLADQRDRASGYSETFLSSRERLSAEARALWGAIQTLSRRIAEWQPADGDVALAQQKLKALQSQVENYPPLMADLADAALLAKYLQEEIVTEQAHLSFGERFQEVQRQIGTIWDYPLIKLEDSPLTIKKIVLALIILVAGFVCTRFVTRQIRRLLSARSDMDANVVATINRLVHYCLLAFVLLFAMYTVNIPLTVFTFFGGALAIGVGFGAQNLINNFISGLILMVERPIRIGDIIEVDGKAGRVAEIGARCSRLAVFSGVDILVPNSKLLEQNVINWTLSDQKRRYSVRIGVAYGSPTREVSKLMLKAVEDHGKILKNPEPVAVFQDFGDNSLTFEVFFWLPMNTSTDSRVVCSDIRHMIDKLFRDAAIDIAYPQRDLHVDFTKPLDVRIVPPDPAAETEPTGSGEPQ